MTSEVLTVNIEELAEQQEHEELAVVSDPEEIISLGEAHDIQEEGALEPFVSDIPAQEEASPVDVVSEEEAISADIAVEEEAAPTEAEALNLKAFSEGYEKAEGVEAKLQLAVGFMKQSMSQGNTPFFKGFWEARRLALPLFKENIAPTLRAELWLEFSELSKEARRLKELLDAESAFAVEQIDIAVKALEEESQNIASHLVSIAPLELPEVCATALEESFAQYDQIQRELHLLNTYAARVNALRKELLKTDMRIRYKNKFFKRLSTLGDAIFPRRKELIKEVSALFTSDVDAFVKMHFVGGRVVGSIFDLREIVKSLQGFAKALTLNTAAFNETRQKLSTCWDQIKNIDKERRKVKTEQKEKVRQRLEGVTAQFQPILEAFEKQELSLTDADRKMDELSRNLVRAENDRDEKKALREHLDEIRKPIRDALQQLEDAHRERMAAQEQQRRNHITAFEEKIESLRVDAPELSVDDLVGRRDALLADLEALQASKTEKMPLERYIRSFRDLITEKREKAVLQLSDTDKVVLDRLKALLEDRLQQRAEVKKQLEEYRKASSESGWDFAKAMMQQQLIAQEKQTLENIEHSIDDVETKIAELEATL